MRTTGPRGGVAYLQYSFAPRLYIFNAFLQSLIGLYDSRCSPATRAPARSTTRPSPRRERQMPYSDVGDWSLYNYRGHESNADYHELLREFLAEHVHAPARARSSATYAKRYRGYQVDPPVLTLNVPDLHHEGRA